MGLQSGPRLGNGHREHRPRWLVRILLPWYCIPVLDSDKEAGRRDRAGDGFLAVVSRQSASGDGENQSDAGGVVFRTIVQLLRAFIVVTYLPLAW